VRGRKIVGCAAVCAPAGHPEPSAGRKFFPTAAVRRPNSTGWYEFAVTHPHAAAERALGTKSQTPQREGAGPPSAHSTHTLSHRIGKAKTEAKRRGSDPVSAIPVTD